MARAERVWVPLKAMCSSMCAMPFSSALSCRVPQATQMPSEADFDLRHGVDRHAQAVGESGDLDLAHGRTIRPAAWAPPLHAVVDQLLQRLDVVGQAVDPLGAVIRSASRGGSCGRSPVAFCTASGNLAGWAVASTTIGTLASRRCCWATA